MTQRATLGRRGQAVVIFLVSMAGLLLEVSYTRIVSYKLLYYYVYLVIGLALLGIGTGAIALTTIRRLREASTDAILTGSCWAGAILVPIGYVIVARLPIDTVNIWDYGSAKSFRSIGALGLISFVLFASFIAVGLVVATILGRAEGRVGGLYFGDLVGAGLACLVAIPIITAWGPPAAAMLAAFLFALAALAAHGVQPSLRTAGSLALCAALLFVAIAHSVLPDVLPEHGKLDPATASYSAWGPVFRVDVDKVSKDAYLLAHDALFGSGIWRYNDNPASVTRFDDDPRRFPFALLGAPPAHTLIVGSAGGNEIVAALHFGSKRIEGVELNPVTVSLLTGKYADFTGHLTKQPGVTIHNADAQSFVARSHDHYDLLWFVAPDSYAANNAVSSSAFVLSESYLYTEEMIKRSLTHLAPDGVMVTMFGELDFANRPDRTARYVVTARAAMESLGIHDPQNHLVVLSDTGPAGTTSTIITKRKPFTRSEITRLVAAIPNKPLTVNTPGKPSIERENLVYAPGEPPAQHIVARLAAAPSPQRMKAVEATYPLMIDVVHDDRPFFWHFAGFGSVLHHILKPVKSAGFDPENSIGERVLLLLLAISLLYAVVFLFAPFLFVRKSFAALPARTISAVYFGALGLGFILFEVTMIQRLTRMLGYPTYSLTVTLAALLLSTGVGALASRRFEHRSATLMLPLFVFLCVLTAAYEFGLDRLTDSVLDASLGARLVAAVAVLSPLGFCLGMFMPLGLTQVHRIAPGGTLAAWAWAANGFLAVVGSVLATILAMSYGFRTVQWLALAVYAVAALAFVPLARQPSGDAVATVASDETTIVDVPAYQSAT